MRCHGCEAEFESTAEGLRHVVRMIFWPDQIHREWQFTMPIIAGGSPRGEIGATSRAADMKHYHAIQCLYLFVLRSSDPSCPSPKELILQAADAPDDLRELLALLDAVEREHLQMAVAQIGGAA